jgi:hypothetical protein
LKTDCDASLEPQGYSDSTHIIIGSLPGASVPARAGCNPNPSFVSLDLVTGRVKPGGQRTVRRLAQSIAGPVHSCKNDPDVISACYTSRARLALLDNGPQMLVWPVGAAHYLAVSDDMLPSNLSSKVGPAMRVYATMVICPLVVDKPGPRVRVCVDAATDFRPDPVSSKAVRHATASHTPSVTAVFH